MKWRNMPFDNVVSFGKKDLAELSAKAILALSGHPVRILQHNILKPEYFGFLDGVMPNEDVILILRRDNEKVEVTVDKTITVQMLCIGN